MMCRHKLKYQYNINGTYASIMPVALFSDSQVLETSAGLLEYDSNTFRENGIIESIVDVGYYSVFTWLMVRIMSS